MLEKVEDNRKLKVLLNQMIRGRSQEKHEVVLQEGLEKWNSMSISIGKDHHRSCETQYPVGSKGIEEKRILRPLVAKTR
jgi:hypothetical protein